MRTCRQCQKDFLPKSPHKSCNSCRYENRKRPCPICGVGRIDPRSATCFPCRVEKGRDNGNWKGGTTYHKKGYVMVRHSRDAETLKTRYVFQHIVVMEEHLGRRLFDGENVHHINGVKDDNRIENLELWVRPQPAGVRAADAVAWAKTILARYPELV